MKTQNIYRALMTLAVIICANMIAKAQGDLAIYDLKGKVKTCKWVNDMTRFLPYDNGDSKGKATTYTFSTNGRISKIGGQPAVKPGGPGFYEEASRDAKGRMKSATLHAASRYMPGYGTNAWTYNQNGKVASYIYEEAGVKVTTTYGYNQQGQMSKATLAYSFDPEDFEGSDYKSHTTTITYTYTAKDQKGNWTKRTAKASDGNSWTETRTITYYQ